MRFYNEVLSHGADRLGSLELAALGKVLDAARNRKLLEEREKAKGPGAAKKKASAKVNLGGERHGVPDDDYDGDYSQDYGPPSAAGPATGAAAAGGGGGGVSSSGNNTNVDLSLAAAGLKASPAGAPAPAGAEGGKFSRTKFTAEEDFM